MNKKTEACIVESLKLTLYQEDGTTRSLKVSVGDMIYNLEYVTEYKSVAKDHDVVKIPKKTEVITGRLKQILSKPLEQKPEVPERAFGNIPNCPPKKGKPVKMIPNEIVLDVSTNFQSMLRKIPIDDILDVPAASTDNQDFRVDIWDTEVLSSDSIEFTTRLHPDVITWRGVIVTDQATIKDGAVAGSYKVVLNQLPYMRLLNQLRVMEYKGDDHTNYTFAEAIIRGYTPKLVSFTDDFSYADAYLTAAVAGEVEEDFAYQTVLTGINAGNMVGATPTKLYYMQESEDEELTFTDYLEGDYTCIEGGEEVIRPTLRVSSGNLQVLIPALIYLYGKMDLTKRISIRWCDFTYELPKFDKDSLYLYNVCADLKQGSISMKNDTYNGIDTITMVSDPGVLSTFAYTLTKVWNYSTETLDENQLVLMVYKTDDALLLAPAVVDIEHKLYMTELDHCKINEGEENRTELEIKTICPSIKSTGFMIVQYYTVAPEE